MKTTVITLKNSESADVSNLLELALQNLNYTREQVLHYTLLLEDALICWRERLPPEAVLSVRREERKSGIRFRLTLEGERADPFRVEEGSAEPLNRMVDKLLSGVGSELSYRYRGGTNTIVLRLPRKNAEAVNFRRNLFILMAPILIQQLFQMLSQNANALLLGFLDANAMSAISLVNKFVQIHTFLFVGITVGATTLFSQYWGARDREKSARVASAAGWIGLAGSLLFSLIALTVPETVMRFYTDIPELIGQGARYLRLMGVWFLLVPFYQIPYCLMRNCGYIRRVAVFSLSGCAINLICTLIFIFVLKTGVEGAALAQLISAAAQALLCGTSAIRHPMLRMRLFDKGALFGPEAMLKPFLKRVWPAIVQNMIWIIGINIMTAVFGHLEPGAVAAVSALNIVTDVLVMSTRTAIGDAGAILTGNLLGRGKLEEAKKRGAQLLRIGAVYGLFVVGLFLAGVLLLRVLPMDLSEEAHVWCGRIAGFFALNAFFNVMNSCTCYGLLHAGGDSRGVLIVDAIVVWGILVPVSLLKLFALPSTFAVTLAVTAILKSDEVISFPLKYLRSRKGIWLKKVI